MDNISEQRLAQVYPELANRVRQMFVTLALEGIYIRLTAGYRSIAEQQALYEQGRSRAGEIITNCRGGYSWHNFGLAVDLTPGIYGPGLPYNPDWNESHPAWLRMEAEGKKLGLDVGAYWPTFHDGPHFQLRGRFGMNHPDDEVRALEQSGGLQAVWDEVTKSLQVNSTQGAHQ